MCQRLTPPTLSKLAVAGGWRWRCLLPLFLLPLVLLLNGCTPPEYRLSTRYQSANQNERIAFLILHYTDEDDANSLRLLTEPEHKVSAHYLIPRDSNETPLTVYQLVPDSARAWHAGRSRWHQYAGLNASSLGIEIVNLGYPAEDEPLPPEARRWQPYTPQQIAAVGAISRELVARYQIPPTQVLGHSDIAPERKQDPGPHFPWRQLYLTYGVGAWPDEGRVAELLASSLPDWDAAMWQQQLARYGYGLPQTGQWDEQSRTVMGAFQLHFRASKVDSEPDRECQAILMALLEKYFP